MIPIGPIIIAAVMAARAAQSGSGPKGTFQGRTPYYIAIWAGLLPMWLGAFAAIWGDGGWAAAIAFLFLTPIVWAGPLWRRVAVPLGLAQLAWFLAFFDDWRFGRDRRGGAALCATLAAGRRRSAQPFARSRVECLQLVSGAGAVAAALLADQDGDSEGARALMEAATSFDPRVTPRLAADITSEWMAADLAHRGCWSELAQRPQRRWSSYALAVNDVEAWQWQTRRHERKAAKGRPRSSSAPPLTLSLPSGHWAKFLQGVAQRFVQDPRAPSDVGLRLRWLLAPHRQRSLPLLRRGLLVPLGTAEPRPLRRFDADVEAPVLPRALLLHADIVAAPDVAVGELRALARAWQRALTEIGDILPARARALGAIDGDGAARSIEHTVVGALATLAERLDFTDVELDEDPLLAAAVQRVRGHHCDALEVAAAALRSRAEQKIERPPLEELREWASLRLLYTRVARTGKIARVSAYELTQWAVTEQAVRLWNERKEPRLGNAMFRWLLEEAVAIGDTHLADVQEANVKCGP